MYPKDIINVNLTSEKNIIKNTFPYEIGSNYMEKVQFQGDFFLLKSKFNFKNLISLKAKEIKDEKNFVITIALKGDSFYKNFDDKELRFKEGFTTISLFSNTSGFREFKTNEINQVRIILKESFLKRNLKNRVLEKYFYNNENLNLIDFSPTTLHSQMLLNDILTCNLQGELYYLYTQAKALELLSLKLIKLSKNEKNEIFLDDYDKDAIYKAKEILINNLSNPPSIVTLAKMVHLNEFKLKKGFKQVFNTSPYKLLNQYKMNLAKKLLKENIYNINEIAQIVGYKYPNNFTNAFFKEFKILPKDFIKSKKYYL